MGLVYKFWFLIRHPKLVSGSIFKRKTWWKEPKKIAIVFSSIFAVLLVSIIFRNQISTFFSNTGAEPIAYWKLDEGYGDDVYDSGSGKVNGLIGHDISGSSPTFVSKGTMANGSSAITVGLPTSYQEGDLLMIFAESANQTIATPDTWTEIPNSPVGRGGGGIAGGVRLAIFYKVATASESTVNMADPGDHIVAVMAAFRNVDTANPINTSVGSTSPGNVGTLTFPAVTTTIPNTLILNVVAHDKDANDTLIASSWTNTNLTSLAEIHDQSFSDGQGGGISIATGIKATAGNTGNTTASADATDERTYITLALASVNGWGAEPTWKSTEECISGNCLLFDGSEDAVTIGNTEPIDFDSGLSSDFTFSAWVRPLSTGVGATGQIFAKGDNTYLQITNQESDGYADLVASVDLATTDATVNIANAIELQKWQHISVTYSDDGDDEIEIYIDGVLEGTSTNGSGAPASSDSSDFFLGGNTKYFHGYIDEFKIYDYNQNTSQVQANVASRGTTKGVSAQFGDADMSRKLSDGLVGYWKMDEATGSTGSAWTTLDSSGNNKNGVGVADAGGTAPGRFGNAGIFDGTSDMITIPDMSTSTVYTVSAWVKMTATGANRIPFGFSGGNGTTNTLVYLNAQDCLGFNTWQTDCYGFTGIGSTLTNGSWNHIVATFYDSNTANNKIWFNGIQKTTSQISGTSINATLDATFGIGHRGDGNLNWTWRGSIDEVRVYNRVLDTSEIKALYNFTPGPVGYWMMDEGTWSGTSNEVIDSSGNGNNGTSDGGATTVQGKYGRAGTFDGTDNTVTISDSASLDITGDITIGMWVNPAPTQAQYATLISKHSPGGFSIEQNSNNLNEYYFIWDPNGSGSYSGSSVVSTLTANTWQYFSIVKRGSTITHYVNGVQTATGSESDSAIFANSLPLIIGNFSSGSSRWFNGNQDDIRIYNYARSQEQIINDMNAGHPSVGTPVGSTVLHLKMDEGYGNTVNDSSPQSNDGYISGSSAPTWTNEGKFGKALSFDGNDYATITDPSDGSLDFGTEDFTVTAWIKTSVSDKQAFIVKGPPTTGVGTGWSIFKESDGQLRINLNDGTLLGHSFPSDLDDGNWHYIGVTFDRDGNASGYVDGINVGTVNISARSGSVSTASNLYVGRFNTSTTEMMNGQIDEVKIYPFLLSVNQINQDFNQGKSIVLGSNSTGVGGTSSDNSSSREYCVPGDTSSCSMPIGEWNLNENSGTTIYDTSGNNNSGNLGTGNSSPKWKAGYKSIGAGLQFDGVNDNALIPTSSLLNIGTSDFTLSAWVKGRSMASADVIFAKSNGDGCSSSYGFHFAVFTSNYPTVHFCTGAGSHAQIMGQYSLVDNQWYHVNVVVDRDSSTNSKVYVNGVSVTTTVSNLGSHTGSITNSVDLAFGTESDGNTPWDGSLDQIKIYAYARTPAQVAWEYNRGAATAYYKLDECTGTAINDASENNLNGTLNLGASGVTSAGTCSTSGAWADGAQGKFESSMSFDASSDYIEISDNSFLDLDENDDLSLSFWIKPNTLSTAKAIISKKTSNAATANGFMVHTFNGGTLGFYVADSTTTNQVLTTTTTALTVGEWTHVTIIYDAKTNPRIYFNGKRQGTSSSGGGTIGTMGSLANGSPLVLGAESDFQLPYYGQLDEVKLYRYALTQSQINTEMNGGAVRFQ